jgi:hypothetical protein
MQARTAELYGDGPLVVLRQRVSEKLSRFTDGRTAPDKTTQRELGGKGARYLSVVHSESGPPETIDGWAGTR